MNRDAQRKGMAKEAKRRSRSGDDRDEARRGGAGDSSRSRERFPNLAAERDLDRAEHVRAAEEMGATHRQAVRHAEDEVGDH